MNSTEYTTLKDDKSFYVARESVELFFRAFVELNVTGYGRDKSGCNAGWAYLGMLAKIKVLPGQEEGRLAVAGRLR